MRWTQEDILKLAASVERYSRHPLAEAILQKAKIEKIDLIDASCLSESKGDGLKAQVDGHDIIITSRKKMHALCPDSEQSLLPQGMGWNASY